MKGDQIPGGDHIARYCGGANVHEDGTIDGAAFRLRKRPDSWEGYLSVNWLEYLGPAERLRQIEKLRQVFLNKPFKLGAKVKFAVHEVAALCEYVRRKSPDRRELRVLHEPFPDDDSHCGIFSLEPEDDLIADLIAEVVREVHPARG
jgi:hypothetical protein